MADTSLHSMVSAERAGLRLHEFLRDALPLEPLEFLRHLTFEGKVTVNGAPGTRKQTLREGAVVEVFDVEAARERFKPRAVPADALYEDEHLLVLNKPSGCTVVRRRNAEHCAFQNGILAHLRSDPHAVERAMRERYRPRALHRLDQYTTGAIIEAKTREGELHVAPQFQNRQVGKEYLALVLGELAADSGMIDEPIGPVFKNISRMQIGGPKAKASMSEFAVIERFRNMTYVKAILHTGRRHQLRLHLSHIGHPIVADDLYGGGQGFYLSSMKHKYRTGRGKVEKPLIARPALHAASITFLPVGATEAIRVEAPLPKDMGVVLKMMRKYG